MARRGPRRCDAARRERAARLLALSVVAIASRCGSDPGGAEAPPYLAVLSAMPSELAPNLAEAEVTETVAVAGREIRVGSLAGIRVILGMTGIGMTNAATVARAVLERFPVRGVVVSGVANTSLGIGDVAVPETWLAPDGTAFTPDPEWLAIARELASSSALAHCSAAPPATPGSPICIEESPRIVVGGVGYTDDPFRGAAFPCWAGGGGVFGCDAPSATARARAADGDVLVIEMETAVIAREAAERGLPFIAFRATSDEGDGVASLVQFFTYYGLAADTASQATRSFLTRLADGAASH